MTKASSCHVQTFATACRAVALGLALSATTLGTMSANAGERVEVQLDQARVFHLPANVKTLILGNPSVADITLLKKGGGMVITGKSYGETNLIAVDGDGVVVLESSIRVNASGGKLVVQRGVGRESWICNPRCQPTVSLGDETKFMGEAIGDISRRNGAAQPTGGAPLK